MLCAGNWQRSSMALPMVSQCACSMPSSAEPLKRAAPKTPNWLKTEFGKYREETGGTLGQSTEPSVVAATAGTGCEAPLKRSDALLVDFVSKLEDGNIIAAVRILCDQSRSATPNLENFNILVGKHPTDPHPDSLAGLPCPTTTTPFQVEPFDVEAAIRSFP